jgi:glutathione S-transferase
MRQHVHDLWGCEFRQLLQSEASSPAVGVAVYMGWNRYSEKRDPIRRVFEKNPNGKIPLLETEDGRCLPESNAILHFLAEGTALLPTDRFEHAQVLQWLFFEQYSHEPYIATARYIVRYLRRPPELDAQLQTKMAPGYKALQVMESHLSRQLFFVGGRYTIADIGLFAYTHVAEEGGFELTNFPAIQQWLERVREQPGFIGIG